MKKLLAVLSVLGIVGVASADYYWYVDWSIANAFSPQDTTDSWNPSLLEDYSVTWSLINGTTGDTLGSMSSGIGDEYIYWPSASDPNRRPYADEWLMPEGNTAFLGPVDTNKFDVSSTYQIYQYIELADASGPKYYWQSGDTSITPTSDTTTPARPLEGNTAVIHATDWKPIPEPATMSLLGLGALAMVIRRKVRK